MSDDEKSGVERGQAGQPASALMIYDGDCGFCTYWARRWRQKIGDELEIAPLQDEPDRGTELARRDLEEAVHLVESDGTIYRGAAAVFRALSRRRRYAWGWWLYRHLPGFRTISEWVYRWVANHRMEVSRWTRWMRRDQL